MTGSKVERLARTATRPPFWSPVGSQAPAEGGWAASVPAAVADGAVACRRWPVATEVEVRRYDAGAPTASPD